MASEKAKQLAAKQKAEAKAEKERRKNSTNPADWSQTRQMREAYKLTREQDPKLPWLLAAVGVGGFALCLLIGFLLKAPILWGILGVMVGFTLAMWMFVRRTKKATFKRYEGQAGSAEVALQMLGKKWAYTPVITAVRNRDSADVIHRAIGPGGLFLIGEGSPSNLKAALASEKRKHEQVAYGVTVQTIQVGRGAGQVPLDKLGDHLKKQPRVLTPAKITEVNSRLRALDAMRPKVPMPKGPMNAKGAKQALKGR